jgi:anti-anti-sigma factor
MRLDKRMDGDVMVITMDGALDSGTSSGVHADLEQLMPDRGRVLLDLSQTGYMSSAGLRVLLLIHRRMQATGVRIALAGLQAEVREVMSATGFISFFTVCESVEEGVAALSGRAGNPR